MAIEVSQTEQILGENNGGGKGIDSDIHKRRAKRRSTNIKKSKEELFSEMLTPT